MQKLFTFAFAKVDERSGIVAGVVTAESPDQDGEIFDYDGGGKDEFQAWSDRSVATTRAAGQELSLGNVRWQHDPKQIAGKVTEIAYDNQARTIRIETRPANDEYLRMCREGYARGFSIAGDYKSRRCNECGADMSGNRGNDCPQCGKWVLVKFVPQLSEVSYVDSPCLAQAVFEVVKRDGSSESRGKNPGREIMNLKEHVQRAVEYVEKLASHHGDLGKAHEQSGSPALASCHREIAKCHKAFAAHLRQVAADGEFNEGEADKAAGSNFFSDFLYKSGPTDEGAIKLAHQAAGLFK